MESEKLLRAGLIEMFCHNWIRQNLAMINAHKPCYTFIDGLLATAPHLQEALAEPVAHIKTRLTDHLSDNSL